ncbi:MAG: hypothetical protein WCA04_05255 [Geobacteraceae bacterium]
MPLLPCYVFKIAILDPKRLYVTGFYGYSNVGWRTGAVPIPVLDDAGDYDVR